MKRHRTALLIPFALLALLLVDASLAVAQSQGNHLAGLPPAAPTWYATRFAANQPPPLQVSQASNLTETATLRKYAINGLITNLVATPEGKIWFTIYDLGKVGVLNPRTNALTLYTGSTDDRPWGIAQDGQGVIWYSVNTSVYSQGSIVKIDPINPDVSWTHPDLEEIYQLAIHPTSGEVWFTSRGNKAGINRLTGTPTAIINYSTTPYTNTFDLAIAPDSKVWVTVQPEGEQGVIRFDPQKKQMTAWEMPIPGSEPFRILATGSDEIWITEAATRTNSLARLVPSTNTLYEYLIPAADSAPHGLAQGGAWMWFGAEGSNQIGRLAISDAIPTTETVLIPQAVAFITSTLMVTGTSPVLLPQSPPVVASETPITATASGAFTIFPLEEPDSLPFGIIATTPFETWFAADGYLGQLSTGKRLYLPMVRR